MKRIVPFILLFVALLLHGTEIQAQNHGVLETVVPIEGIMFNNLGVTTEEKLSSGKTKVTTVGMKGYGHVACDGKPGCIATGLDWKQIDIRLDLQLLLSNDSDDPFKNARGRVRGEVGIPLPSGDTRTFGFTAKRLVIDGGKIGEAGIAFQITGQWAGMNLHSHMRDGITLTLRLKGSVNPDGTAGGSLF